MKILKRLGIGIHRNEDNGNNAELRALTKLVNIQQQLNLISFPNLGDDFEIARSQVYNIGKKLSIIQEDFAALTRLEQLESKSLFVEDKIMALVVKYQDYANHIRRGAIPGYVYVSQDIKAQFKVELQEKAIELDQYVGTLEVHTGKGCLNEQIVGYLFTIRTENNIANIPGGTYIPETWYYGPYAVWDPIDDFVDIICSTDMEKTYFMSCDEVCV